MEASRRTILAALTAEVECAGRLQRLCGEREGLAIVVANDPGEMLLSIITSLSAHQAHADSDLAGVFIDLTTPSSSVTPRGQHRREPDDHNTAGLAAATEISLGVRNLLAVLGVSSAPPLIVVSSDERLRPCLGALGQVLHGFLSPADDDAIWRQALDALLMRKHAPHRDAPRRTRLRTERIIPSATAIPLRDDLWFDPATCELLRPKRRIPLTARESSLLAILLRIPCTYIPASELAHRLTPPGGYPIDAHSIQETVSTLRRKLGEHKGRPRLLRVRRGVGYGIFSQISYVTQASTAADTLAKSVEFSRRRRRET